MRTGLYIFVNWASAKMSLYKSDGNDSRKSGAVCGSVLFSRPGTKDDMRQ